MKENCLLFLLQAKASGKKPQKVALKVSPQGIILQDSLTNKVLENVSIYRYVQSKTDFSNNKGRRVHHGSVIDVSQVSPCELTSLLGKLFL